MKSNLKVSFIIVNYNGKHHLKDCFNTIMKLKYPKELIEIIMVDNGSKDGSVEFTSKKFPTVKIIRNLQNEGFAKPNNDAAKAATGDYLALINNDMRVDENWLNDMFETLKNTEDSDYICVGSKILNWDGSKLDFAGGSVNFYGMGYQEDFGLDVKEANKIYTEDKDILFACGGAMIIEKEVFLKIGGFDEDYFAYFEDVDLGWRLWTLGYKVRFCASAICYHKHNSTSKKMDLLKVQTMYARNSLYTVFKNYGNDKVDTMVLASILLKIIKGNKYMDEANERTMAEGKAQFYALDEFISNLPKMKEKRNFVQESRKINDEEIFNKFIDEPYKDLILGTEDYANIVSKISNSLEINKYLGDNKPKILIVSTDNIGKKMAGPGIRYWEFARELSKKIDVVLAVPNKADIEPENERISILQYDLHNPSRLMQKAIQCDIILIHGFILQSDPKMKEVLKSKVLIVDIYDPFVIENMAMFSNEEKSVRETRFDRDLEALNTQLQVGDYFICASESQKNFWIGMLTALGKVNPEEYDLSSSLEKLIGVVPFGITNEEPVHTRQVLKTKIPSLASEDKVIIWGGGVWNWFDPITVINAIKEIAETRKDIKLFFLGVKHPNPALPEMEMTNRAIKRAEELGLKDKYVFFNMDWVEYNDRQNYLLESYAGVSCHFENLETTYSFRTRILDYLWAELPIISTKGDYFAQEIEKYGLGKVVDYKDVGDVKEAILTLADDKEFYASCKRNISEYKNRYRWNEVTRPLANFCSDPIKKKEIISSTELVDISQPSLKVAVGEIFEGIKIGQRFHCRYPYLYQIKLLMATYSRKNRHELIFKLYDGYDDKLILQQSFQAEDLFDNEWFSIKFDPIINSDGKDFYFYIEALGSEPGNAITVWSDNSERRYGHILYNDEKVEGSLCFQTCCKCFSEPSANGIKIPDMKETENVIDALDNVEDIENMLLEIKNSNSRINQIKEIERMRKDIENLSNNMRSINTWIDKMNRRMQKLKKIPFLSRFKKLFK